MEPSEVHLLQGGASTYSNEWPADPSYSPATNLSTEFLPIEPLYPEISHHFTYECEPTSLSELLVQSPGSPEFYFGLHPIAMSPPADDETFRAPNIEREDLNFSTTGINTNYNDSKEEDQEYKTNLNALNQDPQPTVFSAEFVDDLCVEDILDIINEDSEKMMDSDSNMDMSFLIDLYEENNNEVDKSTQEILELLELPEECNNGGEFMTGDSEQFMNLNMASNEDIPIEFCNSSAPQSPGHRNLKLNITNPVGGQQLINGLNQFQDLNTPEIVQDVFQLQQNFPSSLMESQVNYDFNTMETIKSEPSEQGIDNEEVQEIFVDQSSHSVKEEPILNFTIVEVPSPSNTTSTSWAVQSTSYANSPAGCSSNSSNNDSPSSRGTKRGRGRPRKEIRTEFNKKDYEGLSPAEKKYKMLRDKNNEASRKSRMNRTQKVAVAGIELGQLKRAKQKLESKLRRLVELEKRVMDHLMVKF